RTLLPYATLFRSRANEVLEQRVNDRTADLHRLAYFDPVTRRPNRLKLLDELQELIDDSADTNTAVVLLDIERFSFLNETMGYEAGTAVLRAFASRLARALENRPGPSPVVVGRFGADGFACLLPHVRGEAELQEAVDFIKQTV